VSRACIAPWGGEKVVAERNEDNWQNEEKA